MNKSVAVHRAVGASAIDTVPNVRLYVVCIVKACTRFAVGYMHESVSVDASHIIVFCSLCLGESFAATEHLTVDITADDVHERAIVFSLVAKDGTVVALVESRNARRSYGIILSSLFTDISHIAATENFTVDVGIVGNLNHSSAEHASHIREVNTVDGLWCHTSTATEHIAIGFCTLHKHLRISFHLSRGVVFCRLRVAETTAVDTVQECLSVNSHLGIAIHDTRVSTTHNAEDGEVWNTL